MLLLPLAQVRSHGVQVIIMPLSKLLTHTTYFFDNRVFEHRQSSISSSGVQIIGQT